MKKLVLIVFICLSFGQINAQTIEEIAKERAAEIQALKDKRDHAINAYKADLQKYISEEDQKFSEFLKKRWSEYEIFNGKDIPHTPKPIIPPKFIPDSIINRVEPVKIIIDPEVLIIDNSDLKPTKRNLIPITPNKTTTTDESFIEFNFYGSDIVINMNKKDFVKFDDKLCEESFSKYWTEMARVDFSKTLNQLIQYSNDLNLNDWAYYMLVDRFAQKVYSNDKYSSDLLTWFLLVKSGYNAKIGFNANELGLMLACKQQIFRYSYVDLNGVNYYLPKSLNSTLFTYKKKFEGADKFFNISLFRSPIFGSEIMTRDLSFNYKGEKHSFAFSYESGLISFYNEYPIVDFSNYFNASVSDATQKSIVSQLKPLLDNKSKLEQVEILLAFIQQAFPYQTDEEQFGGEKYFFVEDMFSYPYSDCEDRSVLFTYLVKSLVGVNTLGVKSPGHMFAAVEFEDIHGDFVNYNGRKYTVCDPTYMGASVGFGMPDAMETEISVIPVKK